MKTLILKLAATGTLALAALSISSPANACRPNKHCGPSSSSSSTSSSTSSSSSSSTSSSTGGTQVPAPAGFALFGLAALGLAARNRFARRQA